MTSTVNINQVTHTIPPGGVITATQVQQGENVEVENKVSPNRADKERAKAYVFDRIIQQIGTLWDFLTLFAGIVTVRTRPLTISHSVSSMHIGDWFTDDSRQEDRNENNHNYGEQKANQTSKITRPNTHNVTTNSMLTEAQAIVGLDIDSRRAVWNEAVTELRVKCPSCYRGIACYL